MTTPKRPRGRQLGYRAANPRNQRLAVAVTEAEKIEYEAMARSAGETLSAFVRRAIEMRG